MGVDRSKIIRMAVGTSGVSADTTTFVTNATNTAHLTTTAQLQCFGGHQIDEEFLVYDDGLMVARCKACHARIVMQEIPAGDVPARVRGLIAALMDVPDVPPLLVETAEKLRSDLAQLVEAAEETQELLRVVDAIIAARV